MFNEAIKSFDRALAMDPNYKEALGNKGTALSNLGRYADAIKYLDRALATDPNYKYALAGKSAALNNWVNNPSQPNHGEECLVHPYGMVIRVIAIFNPSTTIFVCTLMWLHTISETKDCNDKMSFPTSSAFDIVWL